MTRMILVLLLGVFSAGGSYVGWLSYRNPCSGEGLDCQLEWMREELNLSSAQYAAIRAIHESSSAQLVALSTQVSHLRRELAEFERERSTVGQIDFLEFARFVENRRVIDQQCRASTAALVARISDVMNDRQRQRYLALLSGTTPSSNPTRIN